MGKMNGMGNRTVKRHYKSDMLGKKVGRDHLQKIGYNPAPRLIFNITSLG